jgi:hypothetical protein
MSKKLTILFFLLLLGVYSCTKDSPPDYPSVQITSPYSLAYFNVPGTIQVTGYVSDSKSLTSVTVYIGNGQNTAVEETIQIPITSDNMNVSCAYELNDIHMPSGVYYMTITASNGTNVTSAFKQIYVTALPAKRTAVYAITRDAAGVHAWGIDSVFKVSPAFSYTVPGDYSSSAINSYYQQLYIAGHDSGNVTVYSVPYVSSDWNLVGSVGPQPYFTNVYCNNDLEYVSYYSTVNGYIRNYNHRGVIQAVYNAPAGYYPIKTYLWNGWLFAEEKNISSTSENLVTFYSLTGGGYEQTTISGPVVEMFGYDSKDIFIFGNSSSGGGYIKMYNIPGNTFYTPAIPLNSYGQLLSAAQINSNTYLISFSNGNVYQYTYNPVSIVSYINGITASTVRYDSIDNQVITASGNIVNEYNYGVSSATLANSVTISDSVRDLRILFNK